MARSGELAKKIKESGACKYGLTSGWQSWVQLESFSAWHNVPFATNNNGYDGLDTKLLFNSPLHVKHIDFLSKLQKDGVMVYVGRKSEAINAFTSGEAGILMNSSGSYAAVKAGAKFQWGVALLPYWPDVKGAPQNTVIGGAAIWAMAGHSKDAEKGAAAFLNYLLKPEVQARFHQLTGYVPVTLEGYELTKQQGFYDKNPGTDIAVKALSDKKPTINSLACASATSSRSATSSTKSSKPSGPARRPPAGARRRCGTRQRRTGAFRQGQQEVNADPQHRGRGPAGPPPFPPGRLSRPFRRKGRPQPAQGAAMQDGRYAFRGKKHLLLPLLFLLPQLAITVVFFFYPAGEALMGSFYMEDSFGLSKEFVGLDNFITLFSDPSYLETLRLTLVFSLATIVLTMGTALLFAVLADQVNWGGTLYKSMLIIPYAVAPPLAGVLWLFLFNPSGGVLTELLHHFGYTWNHKINGNQALFLLIVSASWKQISYNFLFFLAGLHAIPRSLIEAAAIDGASPWRRFRTIIFPLLSPTSFFLLVVNTIYTLFETFGIVHAVTQGGPSKATETLIYKVFNDGFIGLDFGGSSAQSVVLMLIVMVLTFLQFRYVERKVTY